MDYAKARSFYNRVLFQMKQSSIDVNYWIKYGNCCKHMNDISEAINAYRNAVKTDPTNCEAAIKLVELLKKSILYDEASTVIRASKSNMYKKNYRNKV